MDTIVIRLKEEGQAVKRVFLQQESSYKAGLPAPPIRHVLDPTALSLAFQQAFDSFVSAAQGEFDARNTLQENWDVIVDLPNTPFTADSGDPTITAKAFANIPVKTGPTEFIMPVHVRYYRDNVNIYLEKPTLVETTRATNQRQIEVDGVMVNEYDHFAALAETYSIKVLMRQQILAEHEKGRFNK